jgi:hypothetical protein
MFDMMRHPWQAAPSMRAVRAAQLLAAVALYQAEHGKPPAKLELLLPAQLANLPIDPLVGGPFAYRITKGGEIYNPARSPAIGLPSEPYRLAPGQAVIESVNGAIFLPVPLWKK